MATTLPSVALRWHNGRGTVAVAAPLEAVRVAPQLPPIDVMPGMGLDVLDVVQAGVDLVRNPLGALADLVRAGLGEAALAGMRAIGWGWLDSFADFVDDFGLFIKAGWELLERIPVLGGWLQMIEQMGDNLLDTLAYELFGQRADPANPPRGNIQCWRQLPSSDRLGGGRLDFHQFKELPAGVEIARQVRGLLAPLLPEIWRFDDDAPPVEFSTLERHADEPALYGEGSNTNWDIDDDYAESPRSQTPGSPYLKVWKVNNRRILAEIGAIRLVSFWPCSRPDSPLVFEHEGDGERIYAHFQVDPLDENGLLDLNADTAVIRLTGVVGWGHGRGFAYAWDRLNVRDNERVRVATARGSHATSAMQGPARSGSGFVNWLNSDYYPGPGVDGAVSSASYRVATSTHEVLSVYFGPRYFGYGPDATMRWGNRRAALGDTGYKAYNDGCDVFGEDGVDILREFPLLDVPPAGDQGSGACGCGTDHVCARPANAPTNPDAPESVTTPIRERQVPFIGQGIPRCWMLAPGAPCPKTLYLRRTLSAYGLAGDFFRWTGERRELPSYAEPWDGCILTKG